MRRLGILIAAGSGFVSAATPPSFEQTVQPLLSTTCLACHNDRMASGNLNIAPYLKRESLTDREQWERIVRKVRSGEMPPKAVPRPPQLQIEALVHYLESEFEKADRAVKPDPGRVTARRLNRNEYSNTIRDLLAVDFRAERDFPTDDTGYGFDNIGDVLTISPVLMEKYLNAAESIAARALGADPLPKPIEVAYLNREKRIRRPDISTIEATHRIDFDAEYIVRFHLPGERGPDAKPVTLAFRMDGKLLDSKSVETKPSKLVYFNPYSEEEMRLYLPAGDHVFRAAFINDDFIGTLSPGDARNNKKNKFLDGMTFVGPFPSKVERASRKQILVCDPNSGPGCVSKILSTLARRAYRRPVTNAELAPLLRFVGLAKAQHQNVEQGLQLALTAMLVSPHFLFRVEHDPDPRDPARVHRISDVELASRLSYFLWSSLPDDELLRLAESNRLHEPAVLDAQVQRLLADRRAAAFADNFAGQWLEIRNLDSVKPDPQRFPEWSPELRDAMRTETRMFFAYVLQQNRPLSDFLDARYTFLNEMLARHYGLKDVTGPDFRRVELTSGQRGGILSHASVLTVSSYPTRTSVVLRGKYVLGNILGAPPPPPPPDVPPLDEAAVGTAASLRQQMERHRSDPACASCHTKMDALGFGLENYDALGKWRTMDGKFPVDSSGTLPNGKTFVTPAELRQLLQEDLADFTRCLSEKMMTYALGRGLQPYDRRTLDAIDRKLAGTGYHFQDLIYEIVRSAPFQQRRGERGKS
jgi:Protein of unknown function (DUF1592)/Protein of unknown function (DUF1588)/Protein of unknown function (DUF1587)/Protein of unknown function (DUF1585)/Protein of unknown function (DUF1595)